MPRCVIYRRVSTEEQAASGLGLDAQLRTCLEAAQRLEGAASGPHDDDLSGATPLERRPGLVAALAQLGRGDVLLVAKRDRLARDPIEVASIERAVQRAGARVVSAAGEGTEGDDPASILLRRLIDAFAEHERLVISARTKAALESLRRQGRSAGTVPYGYQLGPDGRLVPNLAEQAAYERSALLRTAGASYRLIAHILESEGFRPRSGGSWSTATLHRLIARHAETSPSSSLDPSTPRPLDPS